MYGETELDGNRATTEYVTSKGREGTSTRVREDGVTTGTGTIEGAQAPVAALQEIITRGGEQTLKDCGRSLS